VVHGIMMHVEYIKGECLCVCVPTLTVRCEWVRAGGGAGMGQENKVLHKRNK
jgi:hypothetical protein